MKMIVNYLIEFDDEKIKFYFGDDDYTYQLEKHFTVDRFELFQSCNSFLIRGYYNDISETIHNLFNHNNNYENCIKKMNLFYNLGVEKSC